MATNLFEACSFDCIDDTPHAASPHIVQAHRAEKDLREVIKGSLLQPNGVGLQI